MKHFITMFSNYLQKQDAILDVWNQNNHINHTSGSRTVARNKRYTSEELYYNVFKFFEKTDAMLDD